MKSLNLETGKIVEACKILDNAKYQSMADDDKIKLWHISRKLEPIATKFKEDEKDANIRLIPSENYVAKMQKAILYQEMKKQGKENLPITDEEYKAALAENIKFNALLAKALKEMKEKEVALEFEPLSEEAYGKLMSSNDWTIQQVKALDFIADINSSN